jgi:hypothetical protein
MSRIILLVALSILAACASYTLVPAQSRMSLTNGLSVEPKRAWAASSVENEPNVRIWTMDGPLLNIMGIVPGLENGASILKSPKDAEPMPVFRAAMGASEVAELFESTIARAAKTGSIVKTSGLRPASFAGRPGFRFEYSFVNQQDDVDRRGIAAGAVHNGRLYLIFFHGARIHYFPSVVEEAESVIRSAQIG